MGNISKPKANVGDILRFFWRGMKGNRASSVFVAVSFFVANIVMLVIPLQYKKFFDAVSGASAGPEIVPRLISIIGKVLLLNAVAWLLFRAANLLVSHVQSFSMARLRQIAYEYLLGHSHSFFADSFAGSLVQRVGRFARAYEKLFDTLIYNFVPLLVNVVGAILIVWFEQAVIAYVMIVWVVAILVFHYFFSRWKMRYDLAAAAADSKTTGFLADTIANQGAIASFAAASFENRSFEKITEDQARATRFTWTLSNVLDGIQAGFMVAVEFFVFYYAIRAWGNGVLTVGSFVLIQAYVLGLAHRLWDFGRIVRVTYESVSDAQEMVEILKLPHGIRDVSGATPLAVSSATVDFKGVVFNFNETRTVIDGLDLSIKGGEKIALIGHSGAGKSTIVKLLLRMYDITAGAIEIDGQNIAKVTQDSLRSAVSLVPQDPVLFHRTLMENIRYGRLDATDEEVIRAAKLAHCDDFIETLPDKYQTYVGERGVKLSGGERQRVAIARAILKNAPILVLDEATSSLDSHSELLIQDALETLMKGKTVIVIAHRLSTIRKMDRIVVIESGTIAEEGTHDQLLKRKKSIYKDLWTMQAGGFIAE